MDIERNIKLLREQAKVHEKRIKNLESEMEKLNKKLRVKDMKARIESRSKKY